MTSEALAQSVAPIGSPRTIPWAKGKQAVEVSPESGLTFTATGPGALLLEFRSKRPDKRVIIDIIRGNLRSRNPVKLRSIGGGRAGYRFATLLAMQLPAETATYDIRVQGAELVVILMPAKRFYADLAVRAFENQDAPRPEELLVAGAEAPGSAKPSSPANETSEAATPASAVETAGGESANTTGRRDEDIFGGDTAVPAEIATVSAAGPPGIHPSEDAINVRLAISDDVLSIGGRLFTRLDYTAREQSAPATTDFTNANFVDAYFDARPSDDIRAYVQGRLEYKPGQARQTASPLVSRTNPTRVVLDQLWLKFDIADRVFVTMGQQPVRWGTGHFWNPTDFINAEQRDPLAVVDQRTGVSLLKLHYPIESLGWNFYLLANFTGASSAQDVGAAARAELAFSRMELSFCASARKDHPQRLGVSVSADLLGFDTYAELATQHGSQTTFWRGDLSLDPQNYRLPADYQRVDDWIGEAVAGASVSVPNGKETITIGAEYYHNGAGYTSPDLYPLLWLNNSLNALHVGRDYVGMYVTAPPPFTTSSSGATLTLYGLSNLSDGSWLLRTDYRNVFMTMLSFNAYVAVHLGGPGEFKMGVDIPRQPQVEALSQGYELFAPVLDAGMSVLVSF